VTEAIEEFKKVSTNTAEIISLGFITRPSMNTLSASQQRYNPALAVIM
jgi:hypothetical protein